MTQVTLGIIYIHNDNFHGIRTESTGCDITDGRVARGK